MHADANKMRATSYVMRDSACLVLVVHRKAKAFAGEAQVVCACVQSLVGAEASRA